MNQRSPTSASLTTGATGKLSGMLVAALAIALGATSAGCGRAGQAAPRRTPQPIADKRPPPVYQAEVDEGVGAGIVIVVDTSGSMAKTVAGDSKPKNVMALAALEKVLKATDEFVARKPDFPIRLGVTHFSSDAWQTMPMRPYSRATLQAALQKIPSPGGGTAIGKAMLAARADLYRSGCYRKYMIVVTDGENTSGIAPSRAAQQIHDRSEGAVRLYFVAFDTSPQKFAFLNDVGGEVLSARNGTELESALKEIYEGRILAEADYGETEMYDPRKTKERR